MTVIVTDKGFAPDDFTGSFVPLAEVSAADTAVEIAPGDDPRELVGRLGEIAAIRVLFPAFSDGRGFTHARDLRSLGFTGRLRAAGHVIADQYAMARRSGFDEVEISDDLAQRQPEDQWRARADWQAHHYQARLRG
ncbi:uncharacterized protein DUF934 [Limimaricola soesokkakensis]|uniref:Uncharacterized protein DUF934 n=1 Tax=Limimaricola soesokkakensis TaxID=1343159 RepID=A0A1X6YWL1_9RHOB|nr:DUF934 domain-containing protein [Limimaricola soesokkakensis]PSK87756.1 uncharacterized protein DUF934 [Limimaricola soesokkakensis]SLN33813.1 hypothetical protein LOS8367_01323 [Limimaricola soesokkakensis]